MTKKLLILLCVLIVLLLLFFIRLYKPSFESELNPSVKVQEERVQKYMNQEEPWKLFSTKVFSVTLPDLPQHVSEKVVMGNGRDVVKYDMYLVQQPVGSTFMISLIHYPPTYDTSDAHKILDAATKEMLSNNSESKLVSTSYGQFLGFPAVENVIVNSSLHVYMKAFLSKNTLFVVNVVDQQGERAQAHFEKAMSSFQMTHIPKQL